MLFRFDIYDRINSFDLRGSASRGVRFLVYIHIHTEIANPSINFVESSVSKLRVRFQG